MTSVRSPYRRTQSRSYSPLCRVHIRLIVRELDGRAVEVPGVKAAGRDRQQADREPSPHPGFIGGPYGTVFATAYSALLKVRSLHPGWRAGNEPSPTSHSGRFSACTIDGEIAGCEALEALR